MACPRAQRRSSHAAGAAPGGAPRGPPPSAARRARLQAGAAAIQHMPKLGAVVVEAVVRADVVDKLVAGECVAGAWPACIGSRGTACGRMAEHTRAGGTSCAWQRLARPLPFPAPP